MTTYRPASRLEAARLLLTTLNYASTSETDFSFGPLTVDRIVVQGFTVTPVTEELSQMLRQVVDTRELVI
jgi:hypothetical protein